MSLRAPSATPLARLALVLAALAPCAPLGCGSDEAAEETDDRVVVKLSFDEATYVDASISTRKLMERVRNQTQSIFPSLRKADVLVQAKRQIDVELVHLKKEPVTVVDIESGITRAALRVRYHYVGLAQVPKALAARGALGLGVLHTSDGPRMETVLGECTANGDHERQAVAELWTVFDPSLKSCAQAMAREQASIAAARAKLQHPDREIVSVEFERVYLPLVAHLRPLQRKDGGDDTPAPVANEHPEGRVRTPGGGFVPGSGTTDEGALLTWEDKEREKDFEDNEDDEELRRQSRSMYTGPSGAPANSEFYSSHPYLQPNYAFLYVVIIALIVLVVGKRRSEAGR